jgi:hypothetical protein
VLDVDQQRAMGSWVYVSSITDPSFTTSETDALVTISGQNFLRPESALSAQDLAPRPSSLGLSLFPNPTQGMLNMNISTKQDAMLFYDVYDVMGKRLSSAVIGQRGAGAHTISLDMKNHTAGLYMIRLTNGANEAVSQLFFKE